MALTVQERQVVGYLPPQLHKMFNDYATVNEMGKSETLKVIVKNFFDKMPEEEKKRIQSKNSY